MSDGPGQSRPVPAVAGVIFDLDGTLIDSLEDIAHAANAVLAGAGFPVHPVASYRTFVGDGVRMLFQRTLPAAAVSEGLIDRCAAEFSRAYEETWNVHTRLYAGIPQLLDRLAVSPLKLAVLSNKPDPFTRRCVEHFCSAWKFAAVAGQLEGVRRKPYPDGALKIARELGLTSGEMAFVGDSSVDMETARSARMFAIGVSWGFRSVDELRAHGAQIVVESPQELRDFLLGGSAR